MDEKMKTAYDAWYLEAWDRGVVRSAIDGIEWVLDYLRSQQESVAHRLHRKNYHGEFVPCGQHWNDGPPSAPLVQDTSRKDDYRLEVSFAHPIPSAPIVHAVFETVDSRSMGAIGTTEAPIKRVEVNDDGSFTVVINHWPVPSTPAVPEGWRIIERANCYQLARGNEIVATLAGPDAEENAAKIAAMLAAGHSPTEKKES